MRIGITFDLKGAPAPAGAPDDLFEEFDDPTTVRAIAQVLRDLGHEPVELGNGPAMVRRLLDEPPDFVFNFAEGQGIGRSREARVPATLETLGIPYTGPDPFTAAVTLDKFAAKALIAAAGVKAPGGFICTTDDDLRAIVSAGHLPFTCIVKPAWEGSSKGVRGKCIIDSIHELIEFVRSHWRAYHQPILVEEFIHGEELTVGIIGNDPPQVVGTLHVLPQQREERFIYSLEVKRDWQRRVRYACPPELPAGRVRVVEEAALRAYQALGCRDVARIDFRLRDEVPYFIEANPLPGLNPQTGDLVILANNMGVSHAQLIERILTAAIKRQTK
jgi:D-alanine-D-alanine ligase